MRRVCFSLPDVGEGLTEAEVLEWLVEPGERVSVNQPLIEVETAKAAVELPCPFDGVVDTLLVEAGTVVPVGTPLLAVIVEDREDSPGEAPPSLVGHGAPSRTTPVRRRRRRPKEPPSGPGQN
ncbi:biotin/lipoyl-containing protein [Nocardiopsis sp. B62]|uniref:biotin/lipoyl-containing protein n=1 Tax=Nocardiopsis sp. B62 TaxID=2824874 RepID=UPI001B37A8C3|nr:biotin/lipoyl-containing protein [Nocardiopsis sp. B62]MBQ1080591.1 hypothetical protein [Nocardiopsis sp. B62]